MICHQPTNLLVSEMRLSLWSFPYHQKKVNCMPITQIHGRATKWITLGALEPARLHWPKWQAHITSLSFQWKSPSVVERLWEVAAFTVLRYFWLLWAYWSFPGKKNIGLACIEKNIPVRWIEMGICSYNHKPASHKASRKDQQNYGVLSQVSTNLQIPPCQCLAFWNSKLAQLPSIFFGLKNWNLGGEKSPDGNAKPWWLPIRSSPAEAAIQLLLAPEQVEASMCILCIVFVMRCKFKKSYSLTWDRSSKKN